MTYSVQQASSIDRDAGEQNQSIVWVENLTKHFRRENGTIVPAVDDVSLQVRPGEFVVLLGPSGCGKTTLLRCVAGLEKPDAGRIQIHDAAMFDAARRLNVMPEKRSVSMIFQSYALWPHMTAFANVAYPLQSRGVSAGTIAGRVNDALRLVGILDLARQFPSQMSGGQQQRVALARSIVSQDKVILFDEPLSNVDAKVREQLRIELMEMQRALGFAALYVTHDQTEAMALAHRIAVMRNGRVAQIGAPREIYERPTSYYVANFIGTTNEIPGRIQSRAGDDGVTVSTALGTVVAIAATTALGPGSDVMVVFRPERCVLSLSQPAGPNAWQGTVEASLFLGAHIEHVIRVGDQTFQVWKGGGQLFERGTEVWLAVGGNDLRAVSVERS